MLFIKQKTHGVRYIIVAVVSFVLFLASPTGTGLIVFSLTSFVFLILFPNYISQKVKIFFIFALFLFFTAAYFYLINFHGTDALNIVVVQNILDYSRFPLSGILLGMGGEFQTYFYSNEMHIVNMAGMYGIIGSGVLLYMFISTIYNRRVVSLSNVDGKINALLFTPLLISLIHYNTFLESGVYSLTMMHLAIAVVLKKQISST